MATIFSANPFSRKSLITANISLSVNSVIFFTHLDYKQDLLFAKTG